MALALPKIACGRYQGERKFQQDSVDSFTDQATGVSFLALSDGIGGADYGHLASRLIVRTAMQSLKSNCALIFNDPLKTPEFLRKAAFASNRKMAQFVAGYPDKNGIGGTLVLAVLVGNSAYFLSIGDSLAYRMNKTGLQRLNADHSLASGIDNLARLGQIDPRVAKKMASRNTLTAAILGQELSKIDCPDTGVNVKAGDTVIIASDGLQTLSEEELSKSLQDMSGLNAGGVVNTLINRVEAKAALGQDNLSICVASYLKQKY